MRDDLADPETTTAAVLIENIHRAELPPMDEAAALARLVSTGLSQREIARRAGISQPKISKRLALLTLPDAAKSDLAAGYPIVTDSLRLLDLPAELRESAYRQARQPGTTLDYVLRIVRQRLDTEARAAQLAANFAARGIRVIDPDAEFGHDAWAHHLWREHDIAAAEAAGALLAQILRHAEYYATTPEPWPWRGQGGPRTTCRTSSESKRSEQARLPSGRAGSSSCV